MPAAWRRAGRVPWAALAACLLVVLLAQSPALAGGALVLGAPAVTVADVALLRTAPGYDAAAAGDLAPGTAVTPLAGPFTAADGSIWYQVDGGNYLPASALAPFARDAAQPAPSPTRADSCRRRPDTRSSRRRR